MTGGTQASRPRSNSHQTAARLPPTSATEARWPARSVGARTKASTPASRTHSSENASRRQVICTPRRHHSTTSRTTSAVTRNGWSRSGQRSGPRWPGPSTIRNVIDGERQQPGERAPLLPEAPPVEPRRGGEQPGEVGVGQHVAGGAGHGGGRQHRGEEGERVGAELAAEQALETRVAGDDRLGQDSRQVDGERHEAEQDAGEDDAQQRLAVAGQRAVEDTRRQCDDEHDRAEDVADGHQQVAQCQRRQGVGAAEHRPSQRPPGPGQECPDHLAGGPGREVEELRHAAHGSEHRGDVRRGWGHVVGPGQAEDAQRRHQRQQHLHDRAGQHHLGRHRGDQADRDDQRGPHRPLALGGEVAGPPGVRVDRGPLSVPDQVAQVVPPAVVGGGGVAVEEVAVVGDHQQQEGDRHRGRGRQRPQQVRPPSAARGLPASGGSTTLPGRPAEAVSGGTGEP